MSAKSQVEALVAVLLSEIVEGNQHGEIVLESPKDSRHGDWAFPCFNLARSLRKPPNILASELAQIANGKLAAFPAVSKVSAIGPYLNFSFNMSALLSEVVNGALAGELFQPQPKSLERVMIEYSQPNTHKALHVGHCRCATFGDTLIRLQEWSGYQVLGVNYIGDEGTHVAKCLWYLQKHFKGEVPTLNRGEFLGGLYVKATELLDLSAYTKAPLPGVEAAKIIGVGASSKDPALTIITLQTEQGETTVVSRAKGAEVGRMAAYAPVGVEFNGKKIEARQIGEARSAGMVLSEKELGVSDNNEIVATLPANSEVGSSVIEIFRLPGVGVPNEPLLTTIGRYTKEVSSVLQELESGKGEVHELWRSTKEWSLKEFQEVYRWLDCRFDHYFFESEFGARAKAIADDALRKGIFVESEGAIGIDLNPYKLGFCIIIKRDGTATYAARDLALAERKFEQFKIDRAINIVDAGQTLHFQQVFKTLELLGWPQAKNCKHLGYAQVVRPDGKMSSRRGNVILFSDLVRRLSERILAEYLEQYRGDWSDDEIADTVYKIALATIRYGMLNQENNTQIVFDVESWIAKSGNTGPYLMYAHARISSIIREYESKFGALPEPQSCCWDSAEDEASHELARHLAQYRGVVGRAAAEYSPHHLCAYLFELSKRFNKWYQSSSVLNAPTAALRESRVLLAKSVGLTLRNGFNLLGIQAVERM